MLNLNESLQPKMAMTNLSGISFAFVLLQGQLCSRTERLRAGFIHHEFSALYKHVETDLYLLAWGVKLKPLGG